MMSFKPSDVVLEGGYFPGEPLAFDRAILVTKLLRFLIANGDVWTFNAEALIAGKAMKRKNSVNWEKVFSMLWDMELIKEKGRRTFQVSDELLDVLSWFLKGGKRLKPSEIDLSRGFTDSTLITKDDEKLLVNFVKYLQQNGDSWEFDIQTYIKNMLKSDGDAVKCEFYFHPNKRLEHLMLLGGGFFTAVNGKGYYRPPFEMGGLFKASEVMMRIMWKYIKK
jgi:hypothetical protein